MRKTLSFLFSFTLLFSIAISAHAQLFSGPLVPCGGAIRNGDTVCEQNACTICHITLMGQNIINFFFFLAVALATLLFVYAGILYVTAGPNPGNIEKAHKIFWNVLIGLIFALGAWLMIDIVMKVFFNEQQFGPWNQIVCVAPANAQQCYTVQTPVAGTQGSAGNGGLGGGLQGPPTTIGAPPASGPGGPGSAPTTPAGPGNAPAGFGPPLPLSQAPAGTTAGTFCFLTSLGGLDCSSGANGSLCSQQVAINGSAGATCRVVVAPTNPNPNPNPSPGIPLPPGPITPPGGVTGQWCYTLIVGGQRCFNSEPECALALADDILNAATACVQN